MDADLCYPEPELAFCDEWPGERLGLQPVLDDPADTSWQDGPDERFGCMKGIVLALFLSLPLWGVIIGGSMFLFKT